MTEEHDLTGKIERKIKKIKNKPYINYVNLDPFSIQRAATQWTKLRLTQGMEINILSQEAIFSFAEKAHTSNSVTTDNQVCIDK